MTGKEALELIGKTGLLDTGDLKFSVKIEDIKNAYGRTRFLVSPTEGNGSVWVDGARVKF